MRPGVFCTIIYITVFDNIEVIQKIRESEGIKRFIDRLYPPPHRPQLVYLAGV